MPQQRAKRYSAKWSLANLLLLQETHRSYLKLGYFHLVMYHIYDCATFSKLGKCRKVNLVIKCIWNDPKEVTIQFSIWTLYLLWEMQQQPAKSHSAKWQLGNWLLLQETYRKNLEWGYFHLVIYHFYDYTSFSWLGKCRKGNVVTKRIWNDEKEVTIQFSIWPLYLSQGCHNNMPKVILPSDHWPICFFDLDFTRVSKK